MPVVTDRVKPVSDWMIVTVADTIAAPLGSLTFPATLLRPCAWASPQETKSAKSSENTICSLGNAGIQRP